VSHSSRLRSQDGFIREILWVALVIAIIAVIVLDGIAIFSAYQSVDDDSTMAAEEALTEYAQTQNVNAAELAAQQYITKSDLELVKFSAQKNTEGVVVFTVTAKGSADTFAFEVLKVIPPLEDWVQRTTHPTGTGTAE
jgi:Tfp pilus assembly protein PilE